MIGLALLQLNGLEAESIIDSPDGAPGEAEQLLTSW
jgi:hypothetical protein